MITSEYLWGPFVISLAVLLGLNLLFFIGMVIFFVVTTCCSHKTGKKLRPWHFNVVGVVLVFNGLLLTTTFSVCSGFDVWHPAWTAVLCIVLWILIGPLSVALTGRNKCLFLPNPSARQLAKHDEEDQQELSSVAPQPKTQLREKSSTANLRQLSENFIEEPKAGKPTDQPAWVAGNDNEDEMLAQLMKNRQQQKDSSPYKSPESEQSSPTPQSELVSQPPAVKKDPEPLTFARKPLDDRLLGDPEKTSPIRNFVGVILFDIRRRPLFHIAFSVFILLFVTLVVLLLHGICVCNKPQTISTWLTRRLSPTKPYMCQANGSPCHTYVMVGDSCQSLILVSHLLVYDGNVPIRTSAFVCPLEGCLGGQGITSQGSLRDNDNIAEDRRYIANVPLLNLTCGKGYRATVTFEIEGGGRARSESICFHTLPPSPPTNPSSWNDSQPVLSFIGGGDYVPSDDSTKRVGAKLFQTALQRKPDASFAFIGGDISYDNNARTCFRRLDQFLYEITKEALVRPQDRCLVPLLASIGNHDGGGYRFLGQKKLDTPASREKAVVFYFKYFPTLSVDISIPPEPTERPMLRDATLTTHAHDISGVMGMIVLDSGIVTSLDREQQRWLERAIDYFKRIKDTPVTILYHNPIYPSTRGHDDKRSVPVRNAFEPIFDQYDDRISLVLENHDHNYKRTKRLRHGSVVSTSGNSSERRAGRGIIYSGDGALGAADPEKPPEMNAAIRAVAKSGNYVLSVEVFRNGSLLVEATGAAGNPVDSFWAH